jgi:hypothetical protein
LLNSASDELVRNVVKASLVGVLAAVAALWHAYLG